MFGIALLFFPSELWIKLLQIELDIANMLSFETSMECFEVFLFFRKDMDKTLSFIFHLITFFCSIQDIFYKMQIYKK